MGLAPTMSHNGERYVVSDASSDQTQMGDALGNDEPSFPLHLSVSKLKLIVTAHPFRWLDGRWASSNRTHHLSSSFRWLFMVVTVSEQAQTRHVHIDHSTELTSSTAAVSHEGQRWWECSGPITYWRYTVATSRGKLITQLTQTPTWVLIVHKSVCGGKSKATVIEYGGEELLI
jgi:hypothetical protein